MSEQHRDNASDVPVSLDRGNCYCNITRGSEVVSSCINGPGDDGAKQNKQAV